MKDKPYYLIISILALTLIGTANAANVAVTAPTTFFTGPDDGTWGWQFTSSSNITVNALGAFDLNNDGLSANTPVGLWDDSGNLLASLVINAGTSNYLQDGYRWGNLSTAINLLANTNYRVAASLTLDEAFFSASGMVFNPLISHTGNAVYSFSQNTYPANITTTNMYKYLSANFMFDTTNSTVPEPATIALMGLGFAGMAARRRKSV